MTWFETLIGSWPVGVAVGGGVFVAGFLWWALADLFFATFDLPFEMLDRWRQRLDGRDEHDEDQSAGAPA